MADESEAEMHDRLRAVDCLKAAHGHVAVAYAQLDGGLGTSPGRQRRAIRETLDAVDWLRRALESVGRLPVAREDDSAGGGSDA